MMNFILPINIWPIFRLLSNGCKWTTVSLRELGAAASCGGATQYACTGSTTAVTGGGCSWTSNCDAEAQEAKNRPNIPLQEKFQRGFSSLGASEIFMTPRKTTG